MDNITPVNVVDEMKQAYGDYALAVLIGRAIPDLYDGLKPVTRRVLTSMKWLGLRPEAKYMKAARVEGETMGKLHPHGGAYGAMVTASQWWTNNSTLVDGWGNWGSPTDGPAAPRYTEAKLTEYAFSVMLQESDTWQTRDNYDGSLREPTQLNVKVPNILVNGSEGIGVGYATKIPTHNLRGVAEALRTGESKHLIPDFPTGCDIVKDEGLLEYMNTGKGSIRLRAKCEHFEAPHGKRAKRPALAFTDLPMHVNTEQVGDQIKNAVEKGSISTVADVRDETDRSGIRLVVIGKANVSPALLEAEVYAATSLDSKFSAQNLVIDGTKPVQLKPHDILTKWAEWRDGRLVVALKHELANRRARMEVVQGLMNAVDLIEEVVTTIRQSRDRKGAKAKLMKQYDFTDRQADAILDMRLSQLTRLDEGELRKEAKEIAKRVKELVKLNSSKKLRTEHIIVEIEEIAERHGNARRSKLIECAAQTRTKSKSAAPAPRTTRFLGIDAKKGVIRQERKLPRGGTVIEKDDKLIVVCSDGLARKLPSSFKGPLAKEPVEIFAMSKLSVPGKPLVAVYQIEDGVYANVLTWEQLAKTTSKGKKWIPDDAKLLHIGGTAKLELKGRRKDIEVNINTVPAKPPGSKGKKLTKYEYLA